MQITIYLAEIIIGAALLAWGADKFIVASVAIAKHLKVPTLIIGVVLVGFGTSFPELIVSFFASIHQNASIAIGNVVGSNIANIGLVLGIAALITPIAINSQIIKRELPILVIVSLIVGIIFWNQHLSRLEGVILLVILGLHLFWTIWQHKNTKDPVIAEYEQEIKHDLSKKAGIIWWIISLVILLVSSEVFVTGAVGLARWFKISELVIGLTIVTLGTSLPELAATIASALRNEHDVAFGHIVGSNIFNSLAVLAMPALFSPGKVSSLVLHRDYPVMLGYTVLLWIILFCLRKKPIIGRIIGAILLLGYIGYLGALALA